MAKVRAPGTTEVYVLSAAEREQWCAALLPVHKQFEDIVGQDNIDAANKLAAGTQPPRN